jgi:hypothetical protein
VNRDEENVLTLSIGIMQPYFLPYIGYFQLIAAVDEFVIYDKIKYTKKGWINRNRFLLNGADASFTLPLQAASDDVDVVDRDLAEAFNRKKLLNQLRSAYAKAPHFDSAFALIERIVGHPDNNLFRYIHHSVTLVCAHIGINTPITVSSSIAIDHGLRAQAKVMALCNARGAGVYINPIGGTGLYSPEDFAAQGIELKFHKASSFEYPQFGNAFVPWLSIVDVLMFNPLERVQDAVFNNYTLV